MLISRLLQRFGGDRKGVAAVEFALILPVMISLFFAIQELSLALAARADVTNMAAIAADLTAQESSMTGTDVSNIYSATSSVLYPFKDTSDTPLTVAIYSIIDNNSATGKVAWGCKCSNGSCTAITSTAAPAGTTGGTMIEASPPDASGNYSGSVILAMVSYGYKSPTTKQLITGTITMGNNFYAKPRRVSQIGKPASCSS
jgi:Flp pilus assembly protein TadG